jgi:hypothetical protein
LAGVWSGRWVHPVFREARRVDGGPRVTKGTDVGTKVTGNLGVISERGRTADATFPRHKIGNAKPFHVEHQTNNRRSAMQIVDLNTEEMVGVCARLVRERVNFRAVPVGEGLWAVVFTGGY